MRHTEFWARMEQTLGSAYASSWAEQHVLRELDGRTVVEALAAGEQPEGSVACRLGRPRAARARTLSATGSPTRHRAVTQT